MSSALAINHVFKKEKKMFALEISGIKCGNILLKILGIKRKYMTALQNRTRSASKDPSAPQPVAKYIFF